MENFIKKCRENSLKITPQRIVIYEELNGDRTHPSVETIYQRVRKNHPAISFDTVNRTLSAFARIGLLGVVEGRGNPRRYDSSVEIHHHLHCIKCGALVDFESKELDGIKIPADVSRKHKVLGKRVVLEAICEKCLTNNK